MKTILMYAVILTALFSLPAWLKHNQGQAQSTENPSIVLIRDPFRTYSGTAFQVMTKRGPMIMTNKHICQAQPVMFIEIPGQDTPKMLVVKAVSKKFDLCILSPIKDIPTLTFADDYHFGDVVKVDGYPFGQRKITMGTVGPHYFTPNNLEPYFTVEYHGTVNPGNSGGPVVNTSGQVIGVVCIKAGAYGGFVSLEMVRDFLEESGY